MRWFALALACIAALLVASPARADDAARLFEKKLRPLLKTHCLECHSAKAEEVKSGLKLDTADDILKGGDNGPSVIAGDVENSFLLRALRYQEDDYQMPPRGRLSDEEIALFEAWVKALGTTSP